MGNGRLSVTSFQPVTTSGTLCITFELVLSDVRTYTDTFTKPSITAKRIFVS